MQADTKQFYLAKNCTGIKIKPGCGKFSSRLAGKLFPYEPKDKENAINSGVLGNGNFSDFEKHRLFSALASFNKQYYDAEKIKRRVSYRDAILSAAALFRLSASNQLNEKQKECCDGAAAGFAYIISGNPSVMTMKDCDFVISISKYYLKQKSGAAEQGCKLSDSPPLEIGSAWIHSFWALLNMMFKYNDHEAQEAIVSLMNDNEPVIRRETLCALPYFFHRRPSLFWEIIRKKAKIENNESCIRLMVSVLGRIGVADADQQLTGSMLAALAKRAGKQACSKSLK